MRLFWWRKRSRSEHLAWCKERALRCLEKRGIEAAVTSMMFDLGKHPETVVTAPTVDMTALMTILHKDQAVARGFIKSFT